MMKKGSSMIELVIAIVVMGFAVSVLPVILTTVGNNNVHTKIIQDQISHEITRIKTISTGFWDENTIEDGYILLVTNGDDELNSTRAGIVQADGRRKVGTLYASSNFGFDSSENKNDYNDIDDHNDTSISYTTTNENYPLDVNTSIIVNYLNDDADYIDPIINFDFNQTKTENSSTNIKMITGITNITNASEDINVTVTLRTFRTNIGSNRWLDRTF